MRYAVTSKELTVTQLQNEIKRSGGRNLKVASASKQVFCDLNDVAVGRLKSLGCSTTKVGGVRAVVALPVIAPPTPVAGVPTYSPAELTWAIGLEDLRSLTDPPLYGGGINVAVVGTGIRETHVRIKGRIVFSKNYTTDPMKDGFDHDTGVCDIIVTAAPLCGILNLKVLSNKGQGSEEDVALAIDDCISFWDTKPNIAPTVINLSLGGPDENDPSNPLRVACRAAIDKGIFIFASAGNGGPAPYSITSPACEKYVIAVGSANYEPFVVSGFSSRGPTLEGLIKPDAVLFGEDIAVASSESDTAVAAKSGTSFATPFGSAMGVLYHEGAYRQAILKEAVLGVPAAEIYYVPADEMIDNYFPLICLKPTDVSPGKDNSYGCGLPYGPLVYKALVPAPALEVPTMLTGLMVIGMMAMMMGTITKGIK